jgi:hypothetical protein
MGAAGEGIMLQDQRLLTLDNSDVIGAIRKDQSSNYCERARIDTRCVHFLTCSFRKQCLNHAINFK